MNTATADNAFDDTVQLGATLADAKRGDTQRVSLQSDAQAIVAAFKTKAATGAWTSLDRSTVADRLAAIVTDPDPNAAGGTQIDVADANHHLADTTGARIIAQGGLNLCGPAALMTRWAYRDPVAFATFATQLFETGTARIGSLTIAPANELLGTDYSAMLAKMTASPSPQADWMVLGALRTTTNLFWQPSWAGDPAQNLAGATLPSQLTDWFTATGLYAKVDNQANLMQSKGAPHALTLDNLPGQDIVLLVNANLIALAEKNASDSSWVLNQFPNHYVVLLNAPALSVDQRSIALNVWTWGRTSQIGSTPDASTGNIVTVSVEDFAANYYGAIVATMPAPAAS